MTARLGDTLTPDVEGGWRSLSGAAAAVAEEELGRAPRKHKDWFDSNLPEIRKILDNRNRALAASLGNPSSSYLRNMYREARSNC